MPPYQWGDKSFDLPSDVYWCNKEVKGDVLYIKDPNTGRQVPVAVNKNAGK